MDWPIFNSRITETWREGRKILDHSLRMGAITSYHQMMQEKTREFLAELYAHPKDFRELVDLSVGCHSDIIWLLMVKQHSGTIYHVAYIWLRPEER